MDDFQKLLLETFAEEVRETVGALEKALLGLEESTTSDQRQEQYAILARRAHNLKGAAGAAGVSTVQSLSHAMEDGLIVLRDADVRPAKSAFDLLYQAIDTIRDLTDNPNAEPAEALEASLREITAEADSTPDPPVEPVAVVPVPPVLPEPVPVQVVEAQADVLVEAAEPAMAEPEPNAPIPSAPPTRAEATVQETQKEAQKREETKRRTARIAVDKLDALMNQIGEIIMVRNKSQARIQEVEELADDIASTVREFAAVHKLFDRIVVRSAEDRFDSMYEAIDGFVARLNRLENRFLEFQRRALIESTTEGLLTERLPEDIKRLRMRPFSTLEDQLRRVLRDAARQCDKQVRLEISGGDTEADQVVLEVIGDPLMHLLRNSVDHGIEVAEEREIIGKPAVGTIAIEVEARGATLHIRVRDDGRGINPTILRQSLAERNLMPETHLNTMSDREVIDMIFMPGFSTAARTGVISGRGIGMDVVRQVIHQHHGSISIETLVGEGTVFELTIPLTFATVQGIVVRVLGHDLAVPMYALERLIRISRNEVVYLEGAPTVTIEGEPVSLVPLSEILEVPPNFHLPDDPDWDDETFEATAEAMLYGAVIRANERRIAFLVDDFVGESEMVVKEIPDSFGKIRNVAGATITWSGEVMVILNPNDLIESALAIGAVPDKRADWGLDSLPARRILVCDDSVTTRTLEKNILVAAGYDVATANDGLEALGLCEQQTFQLMILDVDMPELTGFELTVRLRQMKAYKDVPIILVTSRDTEDDKRRGLAAGADAYITKQSFTQRTFLETVRRFLE